MKMITGGMKGISALLIAWITYIDKTFTPLFWVLLALVALDLLMNAHKDGQQFGKIASMAVTLGVPSYVGSNLSNPDLGKYLVAIMCIVYLQLVIPQLMGKLQKITFSKDPAANAADQAALQTLIQKVEAMEAAQAQAVLNDMAPKTAAVIKDGQQGGK